MKLYVVRISLEDGVVESPQLKSYFEATTWKKQLEEQYDADAYIYEYDI